MIVIKLGGDVLHGGALRVVAEGIRAAFPDGRPPLAIVHGGGVQVTEMSRRLGLEPRVIAGRRVTDGRTLDVLKMVVAGQLNLDLCAALQVAGVPAVGLHAGSRVVRARYRPPRVISGSGPEPVDLGLVGDVESFDGELLGVLWAADRVPVLSCLGLDHQGEVLNLNADVVASRLAMFLGASTLVAVSAVGGVRRNKDDPATLIRRLTIDEARAAIAAGLVQGGMIPKLEEAMTPLQGGVGCVQIVGAAELTDALRLPGSVGTLLVAGPRA